MSANAQSILGETRIVIKGAGEMASGVAVRLHRAGFRRLVMLETARPTAVRRAVSFCEAVYDGRREVEGIAARRVERPEELPALWEERAIGVAVDPEWRWLSLVRPRVSVDAVLAKRNLGTRKDEAPLVAALGPGFVAGEDAHCVIETNRGHDLGRVYYAGSAEENTGIPGTIGGYALERVLRAPVGGEVGECRAIGDMVRAGEVVCRVGGVPVAAAIGGVVTALRRSGLWRRVAGAEKVFREAPFTLRVSGEEGEAGGGLTLRRGVIDVAFRESGGWVIVDYKSDARIDRENPARSAAKYAGQLAAYAEAWETLTRERVTETGIYFLRHDLYVPLELPLQVKS